MGMDGIFDECNPLFSIRLASHFFPEYPHFDMQNEVLTAIERMREEDMKRKIASVPGMTESGAAAIWLYTLDGPLYRDLNGRLQAQEWEYLKAHYHPYLRILLTALSSLGRRERKCLYHGASGDIVGEAGERNMYKKGESFVWCSFVSTASAGEALRQCIDGDGTLFQIHSNRWVDISGFSASESGEEEEMLLPPGCAMRTLEVLRSGNTTIIQCEDDESAESISIEMSE
jgi:hypothetical protein